MHADLITESQFILTPIQLYVSLRVQPCTRHAKYSVLEFWCAMPCTCCCLLVAVTSQRASVATVQIAGSVPERFKGYHISFGSAHG